MLRKIAVERLFDRIGEINDYFLEEAYLVDIAGTRATRRKRVAGGTAGIVVVTGVAVALWRWNKSRLARSA